MQLLRLSVVCACILACRGQSDLRTTELDELRLKKARSLEPEARSPGEIRFRRWTHQPLFRALFASPSGFRPGFGGMVPGAGFSGGVDWSRPGLLDEQLSITIRTRGSIRGYYLGEIEIAAPRLMDDHAFLLLTASHINYSQMPYFGSGSDTQRWQRSNFRLEETTVEFRPGLRPMRRMSLGAIGALRQFNVGPGKSSAFPSSEVRFDPSTTPGIDKQGGFFQTGAFALYDWRKGGTEPVSGGRYLGEFTRWNDRDFAGVFSHNRLLLDASQYVPLFSGTRVIALHGRTELTDARADQAVPFYLQPSVGGAESLRGFRPFRFRDRNAMFFNAEYRWETSLGLDMAVFADGGKVFRDWSQWNLHDLETSYGIGFRFKARRNLVMRFDAGASREGIGLWLRFQNVF